MTQGRGMHDTFHVYPDRPSACPPGSFRVVLRLPEYNRLGGCSTASSGPRLQSPHCRPVDAEAWPSCASVLHALGCAAVSAFCCLYCGGVDGCGGSGCAALPSARAVRHGWRSPKPPARPDRPRNLFRTIACSRRTALMPRSTVASKDAVAATCASRYAPAAERFLQGRDVGVQCVDEVGRHLVLLKRARQRDGVRRERPPAVSSA